MLPQLVLALLLASVGAANNDGQVKEPQLSALPSAESSSTRAPLFEGPASTSSPSPHPTALSAGEANGTHVKAPEFVWGRSVMRGVNTGGWLVLEPWITPSLFEDKPDWVVDEWTYGLYSRERGAHAHKEITAHWDSWLTASDFATMSAVGLNVVRIPIGFWSLIPLINGEPYLTGAFEYLKSAVRWSAQNDLKVVVNLHGVPGGQNGWDNSGNRGAREWFSNSTNKDRSLAAVNRLVTEFIKPEYQKAVTAVNIANQPLPKTADERSRLRSYTNRAYDSMRKLSPASEREDGITLMFGDAELGLVAWEGFMSYPTYQRVALDYHVYPMFDTSLVTMGSEHSLRWYCNLRDELVESNNNSLWTVVGEFTTANTDCARWLNGRGVGARFDNSYKNQTAVASPGNCANYVGSAGSFSPEYKEHLARSFETQTWVYEQAAGWIYWTWKTESVVDWSFQSGLEHGWIPTPITAKPHGLPCLYTCSSGTRALPASAIAIFGLVLLSYVF